MMIHSPQLDASRDSVLARLPDDASVRELMRPFAPLLDDPDVTELVINRPQRVLTENSVGWHGHDYADLDFDRLMSFAVSVATLSNQAQLTSLLSGYRQPRRPTKSLDIRHALPNIESRPPNGWRGWRSHHYRSLHQ